MLNNLPPNMQVCMNIFMSTMLIGMVNVVIVGASNMLPPLNESQALLAFKAGISGDPFGMLESWHVMVNDSSPCKEGKGGVVATWVGIVCDSRTRHVITVNLSSFNLSGFVSPSLAFLPALSCLDLSNNRLYGKLPNILFIPHTPLRYLNLSYNLLAGELPSSLANLSALLTLDLSENKFVGETPPSLGQLKNLKVLKLKDTGLRGDIAKEIWQLPALRELWIMANDDDVMLNVTLPQHFGFCGTITRLHLEGWSARGSAIPSSLGDCHKLEVLIIEFVEGLEGFIPPQIWQLPLLQSLRIISIFGSALSGHLPDSFAFCHTIVDLELVGFNVTGSSFPSSLGDCHHLEVLVLEVVGLEGFIPPQIWHLPSLQELSVADWEDNFQLHGSLPSDLSFCPSSLMTLSISGVNLTGEIPSFLGRCTSLQSLELTDDNLQGIIPHFLQNLTNLTDLSLGSNNLTGGIPPSLSALPHLQFLDLSQNNLTGGIPPSLSALPHLQILDLSQNKLTGGIPPSLSACSKLQSLSLGDNKLSGEIPSELGALAELQDLDLSRNNLTGGIPPSLSALPHLHFLFLSQNNLTGGIPPSLSALVNLEYLVLSQNNLTGGIPPSLSACSKLQSLSLEDIKLSGEIPGELGALAELQDLDLSRNNLTGGIPPSLSACSNLQFLRLGDNKLSGEIPDELGTLAELKDLDLSKNKLLGPLPKSLENCSNLTRLVLFQNNLTGEIEHFNFSKLPQLRTFTVQQNNFIGGLPSSFTKSESLILFDVQGNKLSGSFESKFDDMRGLSNLRVLVMSYNNLSGEIPGWLWKLPMLQVLDLSNNEFSGIMPTSVNNLNYFKQHQNQIQNQSTLYEELPQTIKSSFQVLTYILNTRVCFDVSKNQLEGEIAESFGNLLGLTSLNLSHNCIQGTIPATLGKLVNLDELDLSHNNLTGGIPQDLGLLGGLSVVDFSYNNLQGSIPTTGFFNTRFDNTSWFAHNPRLCGAPLSTNCPSSGANSAGMAGSDGHSEPASKNSARQVIEWLGNFTSPWGLLVGYAVGFLGVLYLRHRV